MSVMSSAKLSSQIKSISINSNKFKLQVQEALISCAYYTVRYGQTTPYNDLLKAVGSSTRTKGITAWAELYGFACFKNNELIVNKSQCKEAHVTDEDSFAQIEALMRAAPMWCDSVAKEVNHSIFNACTYLDGVIAKLEKEGANDAKAFLLDAVAKYKAADTLIKMKIADMDECLL